jgi:hypothetical protein
MTKYKHYLGILIWKYISSVRDIEEITCFSNTLFLMICN